MFNGKYVGWVSDVANSNVGTATITWYDESQKIPWLFPSATQIEVPMTREDAIRLEKKIEELNKCLRELLEIFGGKKRESEEV
jgi:hypothetical protein